MLYVLPLLVILINSDSFFVDVVFGIFSDIQVFSIMVSYYISFIIYYIVLHLAIKTVFIALNIESKFDYFNIIHFKYSRLLKYPLIFVNLYILVIPSVYVAKVLLSENQNISYLFSNNFIVRDRIDELNNYEQAKLAKSSIDDLDNFISYEELFTEYYAFRNEYINEILALDSKISLMIDNYMTPYGYNYISDLYYEEYGFVYDVESVGVIKLFYVNDVVEISANLANEDAVVQTTIKEVYNEGLKYKGLIEFYYNDLNNNLYFPVNLVTDNSDVVGVIDNLFNGLLNEYDAISAGLSYEVRESYDKLVYLIDKYVLLENYVSCIHTNTINSRPYSTCEQDGGNFNFKEGIKYYKEYLASKDTVLNFFNYLIIDVTNNYFVDYLVEYPSDKKFFGELVEIAAKLDLEYSEYFDGLADGISFKGAIFATNFSNINSTQLSFTMKIQILDDYKMCDVIDTDIDSQLDFCTSGSLYDLVEYIFLSNTFFYKSEFEHTRLDIDDINQIAATIYMLENYGILTEEDVVLILNQFFIDNDLNRSIVKCLVNNNMMDLNAVEYLLSTNIVGDVYKQEILNSIN